MRMATITSRNPATERVLTNFAEHGEKDVDKKLARAQKAFELWRDVPIARRATLMRKLGAYLRKNSRSLGKLATLEMGKPLGAAIAEVEKCAWVCDYFAEHAASFLKPEKVKTDAKKSFVRFDPLGPVLAVMPWNFPFWQVMRFAAPAVMAGNVGLLKHASNVPQCALVIEKAFKKAGFPDGVFQTLLIGSSRVEAVIRDPRVAAITLTGSERAGSEVASVAGSVIKKTVLELGGSDPFIILTDADIDHACEVGVQARLQNNGQSCIAAKRFIVVHDVLEEFLKKFKAAFERQVMGDPLQKQTTIGPLATRGILDGIEKQVKESIILGARLVTGGAKEGKRGYFYQPTILADVQKGMPVYDEEVFGPVAAVIAAKGEKDAIRIANDSPLGLGASLWTRDLKKGEKLARQIEAGAVFVNGMVKSDPRLPFGGIKKSGYGRELSVYGIREFVNIKTVWMSAERSPISGPAIE